MVEMLLLPTEIHEKILANLACDAFTLHRVERVCTLWRDIVRGMEERGLKFRTKKTVSRLHSVDSLNESLAIKETKTKFRAGSDLAEKAEKIFLSHMEILRLKYPVSLQRLRDASPCEAEFGILVQVSKPVLLRGLGVFLPHGENVAGDLLIGIRATEQMSGLTEHSSVLLTRQKQFAHSAICVDHETGLIKVRSDDVQCFQPPRCINSQRKFKRRCFGIHPYPVYFDDSVEMESNSVFFVGLSMRYMTEQLQSVETVWGGDGRDEVCCDGICFKFRKAENGVRSSVHGGQIPLLYYV